jgi:hypothetical protein
MLWAVSFKENGKMFIFIIVHDKIVCSKGVSVPREDKLWIIKSDLQQEQNTFTVVGFEVLTAVVMKIAIIWDTGPCSMYIN